MVATQTAGQNNTNYILIGIAALVCCCCLISSIGGGVWAASGPTDPCKLDPSKRPCDAYNVGDIGGVKYVCPKNYTLMSGYKPGNLTGPQCHMNNGSQNTPATCSTYNDPECDYRTYQMPCGGLWPQDRYKGKNYYNKWFVVPAMPAAEVCAPKQA